MSKTKQTDQQEQPIDFEASLAELETLVTQMESGDLRLDESLQAFERGIRLTRACQTALAEAELKVQMLTDSGELADLDLEQE